MSKKESETRTGIVFVTHLDFGNELIRAAEFILGPQEGCISIGVEATNDVQDTVNSIKAAAGEVDNGGGTLILTDMFGGTPTNLSLSVVGGDLDKVEVITGVNLPMVLKALQSRHLRPSKMASEIKKAGADGIIVAGEMLSRKKK